MIKNCPYHCKRYYVTQKPKDERGFTLLEVVMAISIFAVGMLAVAAMQTTAVRSNYSASNLSERITLAQDTMEQLISMSYNDPNLVNGSTVYPDPAGNYSITWTVVAGPVSNSRSITVTSTGKGKTTVLTYTKPRM